MQTIDSKEALYIFHHDMQARINPEKNRYFDKKRLLASREKIELAIHNIRKHYSFAATRISVIGSNAKGSTSFFLAKQIKGKTGVYTSPHLSSIFERIQIDGKPISPLQAVEGLRELEDILKDNYTEMSYFECLTLLAFLLFQKNECSFQIYEAGLGGRFDATRAIEADIVVLCQIVYEHTKILGETLEEILQEKINIITPQCKKFFYMQNDFSTPTRIKAEIATLAKHIPIKQIQMYAYKPINHTSHANYLQENLEYAQTIIQKSSLPAQNLQKNSPYPPIPGRLERHVLGLGGREMEFVFDVSHNPQAIQKTLRTLLSTIQSHKEIVLIIGMLIDKDLKSTLECINQYSFHRTFLMKKKNYQSISSIEEKKYEIQQLHIRDIQLKLLDTIKEKKVKYVLCLGSHYYYDDFLVWKFRGKFLLENKIIKNKGK